MFPGVVYVYLVGGTFLNNGIYSVSTDTVLNVFVVYNFVLFCVPILLLSMNKVIFDVHYKNIAIKLNEFPVSFLYFSVLLQIFLLVLQTCIQSVNFRASGRSF